jgi:hypothetical protein
MNLLLSIGVLHRFAVQEKDQLIREDSFAPNGTGKGRSGRLEEQMPANDNSLSQLLVRARAEKINGLVRGDVLMILHDPVLAIARLQSILTDRGTDKNDSGQGYQKV